MRKNIATEMVWGKGQPIVLIKREMYTNWVLIPQEHELYTDVADVVYCSASVWMDCCFKSHSDVGVLYL